MQRESNCVYCGKPIGDSSELWLQFPELPGTPEVRWHWSENGGCAHQDSLCGDLRDIHELDAVQLLAEIGRRQPLSQQGQYAFN